MYSIQYWNERDAEWRGTGSNNIADLAEAKQRMKAMAQQCGHCITFRIEEDFAAPAS